MSGRVLTIGFIWGGGGGWGDNRQVPKTFNLKTNIILKQAKLIWQISNKITPKCITEIVNTNCKKQTNIPIRLTTFSQNYSELLAYRERFFSNVGIQIWNEIIPNKINYISIFQFDIKSKIPNQIYHLVWLFLLYMYM